MKLPLSNRLLACCDYVNRGDRVADIGCDHGYLSIHLLTCGIARSAIASDVAQGPLQSARCNAEKYGVLDRVEFYLSDGVQDIPRDFDTLVCAGMGADTMIHILQSAPWLQNKQYRLILQCQSKRPELRQWLYEAGYRIHRETLAKDGKFVYSIMEVVYDPGQGITPAEAYISRQLLEDNHPLLPEYWARVIGGLELSVAGLEKSGGEKYRELKAVLDELRSLKL